MAEQQFRSSLAQFRWAPTNAQEQSTPLASNPTAEPSIFSRIYNNTSAYVPLRSTERSNEEEAYFALSRWERYKKAISSLVNLAQSRVF